MNFDFRKLSLNQLSIGIFLLNFCTKIIFIGSRDICLDEPFSIYHAQMSLPEIVKVFSTENNPPLHEFLLHFWIKLFGISPLSVRFPSMLFACLTPVVLLFIGDKFFNRMTGILTALIFSFSTFHIYFSHEARVYALFSLLTSLSLFHYFSLLKDKDSKKHFYFLLLFNVIIIYAHYFGLFVLMSEGLIAILFFKRFSILKTLIKLYILITLCFLPNLMVLYNRISYSTTKGTWVQPPGLGEVYGNLNRFLNNKYVTLCLLLIIAIATIVLFAKKLFSAQLKEAKNHIYLLPLIVWFSFPYFSMFIVSFNVPMFIDRYILFNSVSFYLLIAAFIGILITSKRFYILSSVFLILSLILTVKLNPDNNRRIKQAAEIISRLKNENNTLLITPSYADLNLLYYYKPEFFTDYSNKIKHLKNNKIYGVNDGKHLDNLLKDIHGDIIYFQAEREVIDPGNTFYSVIESKYKISKQLKVPQIYTITYFRKTNE